MIFFEFSGVLSLEIIMEGRNWILALPAEPKVAAQLVDFSGVTSSTLNFEQIDTFARKRVLPPETMRAFVAPTSLTFGISRGFEALVDIYLHDGVTVFKTRKEALGWIKAGIEKASAAV